MTEKDDTLQQFGAKHTEIKLSVLKKYATAYLNALKSKPWFGLCYVDGFAGSGRRLDKKTGKIIDGSATLILKNIQNYPADAFFFIEQDKNYASQLKEKLDCLKPRLPKKEFEYIKIINEDVNKALPGLVDNIFSTCYGYDPSSNRVLIFLDPYGLGIEFETLKEISDYKVDVVLLFSISGLYRNMAVDKQILDKEPSKIKKINKILGVENWVEDLHEKHPPDLLDYVHEKRVPVSAIQEYVTSRYKTIFSWVSPPKPLYYENGAQAFSLYLLVANDNPKAIGLAQKLWKDATKD